MKKYCDICKSYLPIDSKFCQYCGSDKIIEIDEDKIQVRKTEIIKKCIDCGKELPIDSKFCQYCGSRNIAVINEKNNIEETNRVYDKAYLQRLIKEHEETKYIIGFYPKKTNLIYDKRVIDSFLYYIDLLLNETEKYNVHLRTNDFENYYYQMSCHCYCAGLIFSDCFEKKEINDELIKSARDLVCSIDTIVTADRTAKIKNRDELELYQTVLFEISLNSLKEYWNGKFDNNNVYIVTMLLESCIAGLSEDLDIFRYEDSGEIYWRDNDGKIRCLGDDCQHEECQDDCPIYRNTIALELMKKDLYDQAIPHLLKATDLASDFKDVWNNLGACYGKKKEYKHAYNAYKTAYEIDNNYKKAIYGLALASKDLNNMEESMNWCKIYDDLFDDDMCKTIKEYLTSIGINEA